jgi:predicted  nucleic acid-binding Zn-ribbon protein
LLGWFATIGLGLYVILGPSPSSSLALKIQATEDELTDLQVQLAADKNSSEKEEFDLSREAQGLSTEMEEAVAQSEKLNAEISGLAIQTEELDSEISEKTKELEKLEEEFTTARLPLKKIELDGKPLIEKESTDKATAKKLEAELLVQKQKADSVSGELAVLQVKRRGAEENFNSEKKRLSAEVKKPHHLHFADKKEVTVRNKVPSGKGIFIDAGYEDGFRDGMVFLGERMNDQTSLPFRCQIGLVQDRFSYLKFVYPKESFLSLPSLEQDEKILLIRSGKETPFEVLVETNSTQ